MAKLPTLPVGYKRHVMTKDESRMFIPIEKPSAIRVPRVTDHSWQKPLISPEPVDEAYIQDVEALAHILFRCPAVIESYIERWMSFDINKDERGLESIESLFMMLVTHKPVLHITSRPIKNEFGHADGYENLIGFLINYMNKSSDLSKQHDYELGQKHLNHTTAHRSGENPDVFQMRLSMILTGLLCHDGASNFRLKQINASQTAAVFSGFKYDTILAEIHDRSAYTSAYIVFLLRYCVTMMPHMDQMDENEDTPPPPEQSIEDLADQESAFELRELLDRLVTQIRSYSTRTFLMADEVPQEYCVYKEGEHDNDTLLFGIPIQVVTHEWWTILWIEWVWVSAVWRQPSKVDSTRTIGLLRIMEDLWRAKSLVLSTTYFEFFEGWDEARLMPFLSRVENVNEK